jgi:hypothetical protein
MKMEDYLYHCAGCKKPDKEYPNKEVECEKCEGTGYFLEGSREYCNVCDGYGNYTPRTSVAYHMWARNDSYGIYTGLYCDKCYKDNYPYKRGRYFDEAYCGERLEGDY